MARTRMALGGSGVAYAGFAPKATGTVTAQSPRPSRYRGGHRVNYYHSAWLFVAWVLGGWRS